MTNELDLLFARCPAETDGARCWLVIEHAGPCVRADGLQLGSDDLWHEVPKVPKLDRTGVKTCAGCQKLVEPRASHYAGVPGHGVLCPPCHKERFS